MLILALAFGAGMGACGADSPVTPGNRSPVILSVVVFPDTIGPMDSTVVTCNATDPDADNLVYDWTTDGRLSLKGQLPGHRFLNNTRENFQVFYPDFVAAPVDTPWVHCVARDGRGMSDSRLVRFIVRQ